MIITVESGEREPLRPGISLAAEGLVTVVAVEAAAGGLVAVVAVEAAAGGAL